MDLTETREEREERGPYTDEEDDKMGASESSRSVLHKKNQSFP